MNEEEAIARLQEGGLNQTEKSLLRSIAQVGALTRQIEARGGKVLTGEFTLRNGQKSSIYVEWPKEKWEDTIGRVAAEQAAKAMDLKEQLGEIHAVVEYCLAHLEVATKPGSDEHAYIESHIAIRLRDVLNREVASTYVGGLERSREHWLEKAKELRGILIDVFQEDDGILLSANLRQRIQEVIPRQEKLNLVGKEEDNPAQGGGAGGFNDPGK